MAREGTARGAEQWFSVWQRARAKGALIHLLRAMRLRAVLPIPKQKSAKKAHEAKTRSTGRVCVE